ncbi:MAG TPA: hypothetical protein DDY98_04780, partial [Ruminococcaceae bacterium]|nr:hypothetical protein [Oscillospiraceae bacterium]
MKIVAFLTAALMSVAGLFGVNVSKALPMPAPTGLSRYTPKQTSLVTNADYYVSPSGNDANSGDFSHPFATLERARDAVRAMNKQGKSGITVAVLAGNYRVNSIAFSEQDSGTPTCPIRYCAYGDGEVVINGGVSLAPSSFHEVTNPAVLNRLSKTAGKKIVCCDLKALGITAEEYGRLYAIGTYNTANKYTGDTVGPLSCELFVDNCRMTLARYPNEGYLKTGEVVSSGQASEGENHQKNPEWASLVNPRSDVYRVSLSLAKRIRSWQTLEDVWMFGFWKYDWADASTPIGAFDYKNRTISPKYVSLYGTKSGAPYYFYNVLEELDTENEWYLDRENGLLYLYPPKDFSSASVDLSLSTQTILTAGNVDYLTFEGFTVQGTRGDAVDWTGNHITFKNCLIKNVAGNALVLNGSENLVTECEITHTGKGGILLTGGDTQTLTPGNSRADNNLIHDWSDIYQTYQPAIALRGVGNVASHNEIYNSPHEAITYSGNNHVIEYNVIHDVCLLSSDAGAIYSGRHWDWYGVVIRYNCIYNIGSEEYNPDGIYLDDVLSGQTVYGNLLVNIPKFGIFIGGGRDENVRNNVVINSGTSGIQYDQRGVDCLEEGWFHDGVRENGTLWNYLYASPWQSEIWQNAYPQMKNFVTDFSKTDDPNFP